MVHLEANQDHLSDKVWDRLFAVHQSSQVCIHTSPKGPHLGLFGLVRNKQRRCESETIAFLLSSYPGLQLMSKFWVSYIIYFYIFRMQARFSEFQVERQVNRCMALNIRILQCHPRKGMRARMHLCFHRCDSAMQG